MILLLSLACAKPVSPVPATVTGEAMGGAVRVVVRCPDKALHGRCMEAALAARDEVQRAEELATDWRLPGEIARLNREGHAELSPGLAALLGTALDLAARSDGAFDPTVGALWGLWDFARGVRPDPAELAARQPLVDWRGLSLDGRQARLRDPGMAVTLGGIAQGWAAARALERIPAAWEALVDVSGDIAVRGRWEVGIQHPRARRGVTWTTVAVEDAVLATSGDYEQSFEEDGVRYHHILDPRTGQPSRGAWSATVIHPDGAVADGLATALVVTGPDQALVEGLGAWALLITEAGEIRIGDR